MAKMGVAVWNYRGGTIPERIIKLAGMGFEAVSIGGFNVEDADDGELDVIAETVLRLSLPLTVHAKLPDPANAAAVEAYDTLIERLQGWHKRQGVLTGLTFDAWFDPAQMMPHFKRAVRAFRGSGVFVCCEDLPLDRAAMGVMEPLLGCPEDKVGILLDVGHLHLRQTKAGETDPDQYIQAIARLPLPVYEVHIHNNFGDRDAHMPLMTGSNPLQTIARGLKAIGFDGIMTLENVPAWNGYPEEEDFAVAARSKEIWMEIWQTELC